MQPKQEYKPLTKTQYFEIKAGDVVERMLGFAIPMLLRVTEVSDDIISTGPWTFNRNTGVEIDEAISVPVSYIARVLTEEEAKAATENNNIVKI